MEDKINLIISKHFNQLPLEVVRMKTGICNEVYLVKLSNRPVIVRMNKLERFLKGSSIHIPVFKSKDIKVPEILVEDYSKQDILYAYQILTFIEGEDLGQVIQDLNSEQLTSVAKVVANILLKLIDIPTNGKFGWAPSEDSRFESSWLGIMERMHDDIKERNNKTGVVGAEFLNLSSSLISKHKEYFKKVQSKFVYDDLSSKNVLIKDGHFNGLVDLDTVMYGDFLEPIGRIQASWYGTEYGKVYTEAVIKYLNLSEAQRKMVEVYAILNRIFWLSEIGIQFNQNTSTNIDQNKIDESKKIIELMKKDFVF